MLTKNPFEGKKEINIVFIGGSITEGASSSSPETSYFGLCKEWFTKQFKEQTVNCYNAGIGGTGSNFGMVRVDQDVISKNPHTFVYGLRHRSNSATHMHNVLF